MAKGKALGKFAQGALSMVLVTVHLCAHRFVAFTWTGQSFIIVLAFGDGGSKTPLARHTLHFSADRASIRVWGFHKPNRAWVVLVLGEPNRIFVPAASRYPYFIIPGDIRETLHSHVWFPSACLTGYR